MDCPRRRGKTEKDVCGSVFQVPTNQIMFDLKQTLLFSKLIIIRNFSTLVAYHGLDLGYNICVITSSSFELPLRNMAIQEEE